MNRPRELWGPLVVDTEPLGGHREGPRLTSRCLRLEETDAHRNHRCRRAAACEGLALAVLRGKERSWSCRGCPRFKPGRRTRGDVEGVVWRREESAFITPVSTPEP